MICRERPYRHNITRSFSHTMIGLLVAPCGKILFSIHKKHGASEVKSGFNAPNHGFSRTFILLPDVYKFSRIIVKSAKNQPILWQDFVSANEFREDSLFFVQVALFN